MVTGTRKTAFLAGESRTLQLSDCLPEGFLTKDAPSEVTAAHKTTEKHPTHEARFFSLKIAGQKSKLENVFVQLNGGDPADDEAHLAKVASDFLTMERLTAEEDDSTAPEEGNK